MTQVIQYTAYDKHTVEWKEESWYVKPSIFVSGSVVGALVILLTQIAR